MPLALDQAPRRILVTRIDRIGDVVLSTPVFSALRERFPDAWIAACVRPETREIVEGNPHLNEVILYDKEGREKSWLGTFLFARRLAYKRFDAVINLHATRRVHWFSFLAGIPVRIGYRRKDGWLLTHSLADEKHKGERHEAEYNFDLLKLLDAKGPRFVVEIPSRPELYFPLQAAKREAFLDAARQAGFDPESVPYVVLNPGASCPSKIWPRERFARLGDTLHERYGYRIVLIGSEKDFALARDVASRMTQEAVNLAGKLTLGMLGHCLAEARLMVSNDSGPVHIAAARGIPVLSLFGRNQAGLAPRRWRPLGEKSLYLQKDVGCFICLAHDCKIHFLCLEALRVEEVLAAVSRLEKWFLAPQRA